jgi:hypothetical protein
MHNLFGGMVMYNLFGGSKVMCNLFGSSMVVLSGFFGRSGMLFLNCMMVSFIMSTVVSVAMVGGAMVRGAMILYTSSMVRVPGTSSLSRRGS